MTPATGAPPVSVVIPTFNRADLVTEAVDSVLAQTLPGVEIIVVDDGSEDDTLKRLARYGNRVTCLQTAHGGPAHARNAGMRHARGRYIAFLDSDDRYDPWKLALQAAVLDRHPEVGLVCTEFSAFDARGPIERRHLRAHASGFRGIREGYGPAFGRGRPLDDEGLVAVLEGAPIDGARLYIAPLFDAYLTRTIVFTNSIVFRRALLDEVGYQDEHLWLFEELDFALRRCRHHVAAFVDVPTYWLRYHEGQLSDRAGASGKYTWIRKQQMLLRVFTTHAHADEAYFRAHEARLNHHLSELCRAVAVPLLLYPGGSAATRRRYARRARRYLARAAEAGHPHTLLQGLSYCPGPVRRLALSVIGRLRRFRRGRSA
ncbi:MAG: glycosyltransferase family 2 protein [Vicinamibacterales bacterium]